MAYRFRHHYTRDEARALLPDLRRWLIAMREQRQELDKIDRRLAQLLQQGNDLGGPTVHAYVRRLADIKELLDEFRTREIKIQDLDRGLIDFPALIGSREVFLCWELDEEDVEFWHDLDTGFAGREHL